MAGQEGAEARREPDRPEPEPAYRKKLRTMDPDLTIICRCGDGDNVKEKSFQCHSSFFALNSSYFDALLSSEMEEAASKQVTLEDVDPDTFDLAMTLVEKFDHSSTKLEDLLKVASIYNRFQFEKGIEYVHSRVTAFLDDISSTDDVYVTPSELDNIIDCALVAYEASMQETITKAEEILAEELEDDLVYGRKFFTLNQLRRLQPFLVARPQWVGDILEQWSGPLHPPDTSSTDFPAFLHSLFIESANCQMIQKSDLKARINFRISCRGAQSTGLVKGESHELMISQSGHPLSLYSKNINRDANGRLNYCVRLCRFGNRAFEFRQCQHKDLDDSDWCMHVTVFDNIDSSTQRHFLAFLPNSKGYLIPPLSTHEWVSLGLVDHRNQDESNVEPLEAPDSFLVSVDRFEHVWGGSAA